MLRITLYTIFVFNTLGLRDINALQNASNVTLNDILFQLKSLKKQENFHYVDIKNELGRLRTSLENGKVSTINTTLTEELWSEWSSCSRSCGAGTQERIRTTLSGREQQLQYCNLLPCPGSGEKCLSFGSRQHCGHVKFGANCDNGTCVCSDPGFNRYTCLPDVGSCHIERDPVHAIGKKSRETTISGGYRLHSCTANDNSNYEVHLVGIYGDRIHNDMRIRLIQKDAVTKPVILILTSYESTNWEIDSPVSIKKVLFGGYKSSNVQLTNNSAEEVREDSKYGYGYGGTSGRTVNNLQQAASTFGPVTSFTGYYELDPPSPTIEILIGGNPLEAKIEIPPLPTITQPSITTTTKPSTSTFKESTITSADELWSEWSSCSRSCGAGTQERTRTTLSGREQQLQYCNLLPCPGSGTKCLNFGSSQYCGHVKFGAICENGTCICSGQGYNRHTCLPDVGSCHIQKNPIYAVGKKSRETTISGGYRLHSCTANDNSNYEVHMVGIYGDRIHNDMRIRLIQKDVVAKPVILILTSYESTNWEIDSPVLIKKVLYGGYKTSNVQLTNNSAEEVREDSKYGYGYGGTSGRTVNNLQQAALSFGPVTSFTGYYELDPPSPTIEILIGGNPLEAKTEIPPLPPTSQPTTTTTTSTTTTTTTTTATTKPSTSTIDVNNITSAGKACLENSHCWLKYRFNYDKVFTACHGDQYVRKTGFSVGAYIGVVLCNLEGSRYKLFMSDDLGDMFLNIADENGNGEDHCELIGGDINKANLPSDFWDSPTATGYYRSNAGDPFFVGKIGYGPKDGSNWTGKYYGTWYECAINIPGNSNVVIN